MAQPPPYDDDDDLIAACQRDGQPRWRVAACGGLSVVLGRGSRPELELWLDAVQGDGVALMRRAGGGCAVLLDPGNVVVSRVEPLPGLQGSKAAFARLSSLICAALAQLGAAGVAQRGHSDLALGERKVGGACIYRSRGLLYYSTTLLVAPEVALVERYLRHPPREPDYRRGRAHRDFMGALAPSLGHGDAARLARELGALLTAAAPGR